MTGKRVYTHPRTRRTARTSHVRSVSEITEIAKFKILNLRNPHFRILGLLGSFCRRSRLAASLSIQVRCRCWEVAPEVSRTIRSVPHRLFSLIIVTHDLGTPPGQSRTVGDSRECPGTVGTVGATLLAETLVWRSNSLELTSWAADLRTNPCCLPAAKLT